MDAFEIAVRHYYLDKLKNCAAILKTLGMTYTFPDVAKTTRCNVLCQYCHDVRAVFMRVTRVGDLERLWNPMNFSVHLTEESPVKDFMIRGQTYTIPSDFRVSESVIERLDGCVCSTTFLNALQESDITEQDETVLYFEILAVLICTEAVCEVYDSLTLMDEVEHQPLENKPIFKLMLDFIHQRPRVLNGVEIGYEDGMLRVFSEDLMRLFKDYLGI